MDEPTSALVLEVGCVIHAPRDLVFGMLTDPVRLAKWWGPRGFTTPEAQVDSRVGGRYRLTMRPPDGDAFHLAGEFLEVDPPSRLVYTFRWEEPDPDDRETVVRLSLDAVGDATRVSLTQDGFATEDRVALHRTGWTESFERLAALAEIRAGRG